MNFGLVSQGGKGLAYIELNKIVQNLARKAAWKTLDKNGVTHVVKIVYKTLTMRITKEKLGQAVPVVGVIIGAGLNAALLGKMTSDANMLYRERFLREKYDLPYPPTGFTLVPDGTDFGDDDGSIPIVELVDEELDVEDDGMEGDAEPA